MIFIGSHASWITMAAPDAEGYVIEPFTGSLLRCVLPEIFPVLAEHLVYSAAIAGSWQDWRPEKRAGAYLFFKIFFSEIQSQQVRSSLFCHVY